MVCISLPTGEPCASIPTASITESGPLPSVIPRITSPRSSSCVVEVDDVDAATADTLESLGHEVDADHPVAAVLRDAAGHVADRPEAEHDDGAARRNCRVLDGLPSRRHHVGEEDEAVVRRPFRHLYRKTVPERDAQVLRLPARHLPVQLRVPEQGGALSVLVHLGRLALRLQALAAHEAVAARNVERHHDPITGSKLRHVGADLLDDPHRLVTQYVALRPGTARAPRTGADRTRRYPSR